MQLQRADFRFLDRLRVRWVEVDMQKIVFNGHYLMYFDTAIAAYWRAMALPYHETMEVLHGDMFVRKATLEYEGSARYDDLCEVGVRCQKIGNSSMIFALALFRGEQRLVHGELVYVFADPATQKSRPVPEALRGWLLGYEAGEAMLDVRALAWRELPPEALALRRSVFADELGVPAVAGTDAADESALHAVARNRFGLVVGAGRLVPEQAGRARIGRLAVVATLRGAGIGRELVKTLAAAAKARGDREIVLAAEESAKHFYQRLGFAPRGARFEEAGLPHQEMALAL
jgi:YbgC/YbaW family acyl-CoA thioester hydrolase